MKKDEDIIQLALSVSCIKKVGLLYELCLFRLAVKSFLEALPYFLRNIWICSIYNK